MRPEAARVMKNPQDPKKPGTNSGGNARPNAGSQSGPKAGSKSGPGTGGRPRPASGSGSFGGSGGGGAQGGRGRPAGPRSGGRPSGPSPRGDAQPPHKQPAAFKPVQPTKRAALPEGLFPELPTTPLPAPAGFVQAAEEIGVAFDDGDVEKLGLYLAHLLETNKHFNLTAITEADQAWQRHVLDALTLLPYLAEVEEMAAEAAGEGDEEDEEGEDEVGAGNKKEAREPVRVIDVGSGGGVPGLPLAIVMPHLAFTLLEPTGKKAEFLRRSVAALGLKNVEVICDRAERRAGMGQPLRESFDAAVVRAVGKLAEIVELCVGFVKVHGVLLAIKGEKADEELDEAESALETLSLDHAGTTETPTGRVVALVKTQRTPKVYPRADGEPKRRPLGVEAPQEPWKSRREK